MVDFRKIDVDKYDPDSVISQDDLIPPQQPVAAGDMQQRAQEVRGQLQRGDGAQALQLALDNPPYGGDEATKDINLNTVVEVLNAIRSDITPTIQKLSADQQKVLLKYLYKGMGNPKTQPHGGQLLSWYEKLVDVTGQGAVLQYISDRRTV